MENQNSSVNANETRQPKVQVSISTNDPIDQAKALALLANRRTYRLWPDVGKMLGLGKNATYRAAKNGDIPFLKVGGTYLVPKKKFDRMLGDENG